jgi:hypothetical protein
VLVFPFVSVAQVRVMKQRFFCARFVIVTIRYNRNGPKGSLKCDYFQRTRGFVSPLPKADRDFLENELSGLLARTPV